MNYITFIFILLSVLLSVIAQILLKYGMSSEEIQSITGINIIPALKSIFTDIFVISGLMTYCLGAISWLYVLSKVEVSIAYPFIGLGFIGTMIFAYLFLNEPITANKILGTLFICMGIFFISR